MASASRVDTPAIRGTRSVGRRSLRERFDALRNLPPFLGLIWQTSRWLTAGNALLRLVRALLPVATLYVGKLILDEVLHPDADHWRARRSRRLGEELQAAGYR